MNITTWSESIEKYREAQKSLKPKLYTSDQVMFEWIESQIKRLESK